MRGIGGELVEIFVMHRSERMVRGVPAAFFLVPFEHREIGHPQELVILWVQQLVAVVIAQYFLKTGWEVVMTPLTYRVVAFLKAKENEDYFDRQTDFNPFRLR